MRLNEFEIDTINKLAKKHFGDGTSVYLFGSRTDDRKKGGDIDLFIGNDNEEVLTLEAKVGFLAERPAEGVEKGERGMKNHKENIQKNIYGMHRAKYICIGKTHRVIQM
jgi:predicted nucleotidyltransferase